MKTDYCSGCNYYHDASDCVYRLSDSEYEAMLTNARVESLPTVFYIDDDDSACQFSGICHENEYGESFMEG